MHWAERTLLVTIGLRWVAQQLENFNLYLCAALLASLECPRRETVSEMYRLQGTREPASLLQDWDSTSTFELYSLEG